ncbi:peroxiredoxin-6-like isoform X4 [Amphibalanus amphitrite]|uniref:peroxiredoxin-6-like isoform X4 n=1 Tax=Amphibalanus amphitrite TaxID=1232801 RepID=UPI001C90E899|nr:peroxiredoxin-6-like isoform X4 [Amphibalanus amphitrite]
MQLRALTAISAEPLCSWCILLAHPSDFTPVCTTEMGAAAKMAPALLRRGVKMACISCDPVSSHKTWIEDIRAYNGLGSGPFPFPIISDEERQLAKKLGMIDPDEPRFDNKPATARAVFIIGPDLRLKLSMLYPGTTGRNFAEIQRIMESLLVTAKHKVVTPEQWQTRRPIRRKPVSEEQAPVEEPERRNTRRAWLAKSVSWCRS